MILNDQDQSTRKIPRHWPGVPTRLSESLGWLFVLLPAVVAIVFSVGLLFLLTIRSCAGR